MSYSETSRKETTELKTQRNWQRERVKDRETTDKERQRGSEQLAICSVQTDGQADIHTTQTDAISNTYSLGSVSVCIYVLKRPFFIYSHKIMYTHLARLWRICIENKMRVYAILFISASCSYCFCRQCRRFLWRRHFPTILLFSLFCGLTLLLERHTIIRVSWFFFLCANICTLSMLEMLCLPIIGYLFAVDVPPYAILLRPIIAFI